MPGKKDESGLTLLQRRFREEYLVDTNGTQAYIRAGGARQGASTSAARLLGDERISDWINKRLKTQADRLGITQERILREMAALSFSNMEDYLVQDKEGLRIDLAAMDRTQAAAITGITTERFYDNSLNDGRGGYITKVSLKLHDKRQPLETLGKYVGIRGFGTSKVELTGKDGGAVKVENVNTLTDAQLQLIATGAVEEKDEADA